MRTLFAWITYIVLTAAAVLLALLVWPFARSRVDSYVEKIKLEKEKAEEKRKKQEEEERCES